MAAGNDGEDGSSDQIRTPGDVPGVITVAATDNADHLASFSSRGPVSWATVAPYNDFPNLTKPDVAAPGVLIRSTMRGGGYVGDNAAEPWSGTSMATPHVSGVAALMIAYEIVSVRNSPLEEVGIVCFKCPLIFSGHLLRVL